MLPIDTSCQAEYEDGFILDETASDDIYPLLVENEFGELVNKNIFYAILEKLPEGEHGKMVRFSVFWNNYRHDIDWTQLPDNARPIRFRHGFATIGSGIVQEFGFNGVDFGYQYNEEDGSNKEVVQELR